MSREGRTVRIGRGQDSDVVLSHPSVSRRHAELTLNPNGAIQIRDLNSTGGTFVSRGGKERNVTTAGLERSDMLRLGDYEISVEDLLALAGEAKPVVRSGPAQNSSGEGMPKTRMVRCDCGTIKERDGKCPACGA